MPVTGDRQITAFQEALGFRLQQVRAAYSRRNGHQFNRQEFARLLKISCVRYSSYERGDRMPPLELLMELKKKTGIDLNKLLSPPEDILSSRKTRVAAESTGEFR